MPTRIEELSVRVTSHPEGDPEPATVMSGWARTLEGRRQVERPELRAALIEAAELGATPHVLSERYVETTWEAAGAGLEFEIAVRRDLAEGGAVEQIAEILDEIADDVATAPQLEEGVAADLVRWHVGVSLDHSPEQVEIEELVGDDDRWQVRVLTHLGAFEAVVAPDSSVGFRKVSRLT